ncbi:DNA glycosylase [Hesseltinella vesiculosa]|uniref:G/T mismatch-specific thymine DNA glycosylase n=1 Tax=Hesseltinella vesiculosa TaxID=101127 RepID=A0A1X2GBN8_9FUNG|nr:DNA glycosylase [Hesseltinella vesiculosa]
MTSPYFKRAVKRASRKVEEAIDKGVPDYIDYDLRVMFVGINPGIASTAKGHHFAGPTNHFWPCLSESGLVSRPLTYEDDVTMAKEFGLGITNLTARTTRSASDLTRKEQRDNAPALTEKIRCYRPKVACFVGKGIYELYAGKKAKDVHLGLQSETVLWANGKGHTQLFVMPSTSGIVSAYQKPDKLRFFQQLCKLVDDDTDDPVSPKNDAKDL